MSHIVVLGAGIGGVPAAFELRAALGARHDVTIVSESDYFQFVPSNPAVALGWRESEAVLIHLPPIFQKLGVQHTAAGAARVDPHENRVHLRDGGALDYDYLVIATGPQLAFDEVEGLGPAGHSHSICRTDEAALCARDWEAFLRDPGPMVVGAAQGASCFGPAYEYALCAVTELRRRKIRPRAPMTFVTPEPYIGHLGLDGVGDTKSMLESILRDRDVHWIANAKINRVTAQSVEASELNDDGSVKKTHTIPSRFTMVLPAFRGVDCLRDETGRFIEGLTNPRGFVVFDKTQRNPTFRNIFAVGVCTAIAPLAPTPVPVGVPKTGYMIESMVTAAVRNIVDLVAGVEPTAQASLNAVCLADFGDNGVAFVALPQIPPRNVNWSSEGYWVHLAKIGFEKYFLRKIRQGSSEPGYERIVMGALGILRLMGGKGAP